MKGNRNALDVYAIIIIRGKGVVTLSMCIIIIIIIISLFQQSHIQKVGLKNQTIEMNNDEFHRSLTLDTH